MHSRVMKRAWALWKNNTMGWRSFAEVLRASWEEAKGLLIICEQIEAIEPPKPRVLEAQEVMYLVAVGKMEITAEGEMLAI